MKFISILFICMGVFSSVSPAAAKTQHFKKVVTVVFENMDFDKVLSQPNFAKLISQGVLFTNMNAEVHPSQGNYIALVAGDNYGVRNDNPVNLSQKHIGDLLEQAGMDWRVYAEGYPGSCFTGASKGRYVRKHNPFISFLNVSQNPARCAKIVATDSFETDLRNNNLPEYSLYVPNMDNDGHDTGVDYAGRWLEQTFGSIFNNPSLMKDTLFIVTFDESKSIFSNHIFTLLVGGEVNPNTQNAQEVNHVSLLRLIEDEYGLGTLGIKDSQAMVIQNIWR